MNWLARLKSAPSVNTDATEPTKPLPAQKEPGFVGFVAPTLAPLVKIERSAVAVNDVIATTVTDSPDRWCWPASDAMNTAEIETFTARLSRFTDKGMTLAGGEALADKLVIRDREQDDRHSCFECSHLASAGGWRCGNWQRAGVAIRARDAQLPTDLVNLLQRCDGFTQAIHFQKQTGGQHGKTQAN
jgi:hypothetical protein